MKMDVYEKSRSLTGNSEKSGMARARADEQWYNVLVRRQRSRSFYCITLDPFWQTALGESASVLAVFMVPNLRLSGVTTGGMCKGCEPKYSVRSQYCDINS